MDRGRLFSALVETSAMVGNFLAAKWDGTYDSKRTHAYLLVMADHQLGLIKPPRKAIDDSELTGPTTDGLGSASAAASFGVREFTQQDPRSWELLWTHTAGQNPRPQHLEAGGTTADAAEGFDVAPGIGAPGCGCYIEPINPKGGVTPTFRTIDEVEKHITATLRGVGNNIPFPIHLRWTTAAGKVKAVNINVANRLAQAIDRLALQTPEVLGRVSSFSVETDMALGNMAEVTSAYPSTVKLSAKAFGGTLEAFEKRLATAARTGEFASDGIEGILSHEISHVYFGLSNFSTSANLLREIGWTPQMFRTPAGAFGGAGKVVSKYATESGAEFMAELFSGAVTGGGKYAGSDFVQAFRDVLIKHGILKDV